ncbi:hypothetical protein P2H44_20040 [Albimonas sp. CAU 1670]|uniref:hypothetical protein n=1 Tax=Albimonas sp. CAU 1670 TaxID=3032599 RepID=UPI0023D9A462|nr:hypothetical protein [Albimonas sp. CAU 1670]MDF2234858.1 hypothetical protein [Albimonas sp. CAU 1670]
MSLPVRQGAVSEPLTGWREDRGLAHPRIAGRAYGCAWCGERFRARRANARYCGPACSSAARALAAAHGPELVEALLAHVAARGRKAGTPERLRAAQVAALRAEREGGDAA